MSSNDTVTTATTTPFYAPPSSPRLAPPYQFQSQSHIHFGATPHRSPMPRFPSSYTHSKTSYFPNEPQALGTRATRQTSSSSPSSVQPARDFTDMLLPQQQLKSMSDLDKEEEALLAKTHRERVKKVGLGISRWMGRLTKGSGGAVEKVGVSK